jgi:hypothetical protein
VKAKQGVRLGQAAFQAWDADQHCEQAFDLAERPGKDSAEGTVRPHCAPLILELVFDSIADAEPARDVSSVKRLL